MAKHNQQTLEVIVLAAGLGTRMKSNVPKVLHECCGVPMLELLLSELALVSHPGFNITRFNIVVGHGREMVRERINQMKEKGRLRGIDIITTVQDQQLGTGHAVRCALEQGKTSADMIAIFNGDLPLYTKEAFSEFVDAHQKNKSVASLTSTVLDSGGAYGRVVRKGKNFTGVVEAKDATAAQKKICEINGGVYLVDRQILELALKSMNTKNAQSEFYLPDVFSFAYKKKKKILAHIYKDRDLIAGVNNMEELAEAQKMLYARTARKWMVEGAFIHDPCTTWVGPRVQLNRGVVVMPFTRISGDSKIAEGVKIGSHCSLHNVEVGKGSTIKDSVVADDSTVGEGCNVGPMAHFRPGTHIANQVKVGNFVEIKESRLGDKTAASHLSYIGDAQVGSNVNIGCGFVTCNYDGTVRDGRRKHISKIGDNVFIGSDSQVVAPIEIAPGTFIASGSTVTESVPEPDSLVVARTRQVTKAGYAKKYKKS